MEHLKKNWKYNHEQVKNGNVSRLHEGRKGENDFVKKNCWKLERDMQYSCWKLFVLQLIL